MNDMFTFNYSSASGEKAITASFEAATWPEALEEFVSFMGAAYGYDIRDSIGIKTAPWKAYVLDDTWSGPVFNPEDCL